MKLKSISIRTISTLLCLIIIISALAGCNGSSDKDVSSIQNDVSSSEISSVEQTSSEDTSSEEASSEESSSSSKEESSSKNSSSSVKNETVERPITNTLFPDINTLPYSILKTTFFLMLLPAEEQPKTAILLFHPQQLSL